MNLLQNNDFTQGMSIINPLSLNKPACYYGYDQHPRRQSSQLKEH